MKVENFDVSFKKSVHFKFFFATKDDIEIEYGFAKQVIRIEIKKDNRIHTKFLNTNDLFNKTYIKRKNNVFMDWQKETNSFIEAMKIVFGY